jgi:ribonuclease T1
MRGLAALLILCVGFAHAFSGDVALSQLPPQARETVDQIRAGGPFPYAKDGAAFGNREGHLPKRERGYYREYTVKTPGLRERGPRRIIAGRAGELYYTHDHYRSFRRIIDR